MLFLSRGSARDYTIWCAICLEVVGYYEDGGVDVPTLTGSVTDMTTYVRIASTACIPRRVQRDRWAKCRRVRPGGQPIRDRSDYPGDRQGNRPIKQWPSSRLGLA